MNDPETGSRYRNWWSVHHFVNWDMLARCSAVGLLFAVPTSRALFNLFVWIMVGAWILAGRYRDRWDTMSANPVTFPTLLMVGLIVLGSAYTSASWSEVWDHWERYSKFLLILIVVSLFDNPTWRRRGWAAFLAACLVVLASTYANVWLQLPWSRTQALGLGQDHSVFTNYIAQGLVMVFFAAVAGSMALRSPQRLGRALWCTLAILAVLSVTHLTHGRTGVLALGVMITALLVIEVPPRWRLYAFMASALGLVLLLVSSPLIQQRIALVIAEVTAYTLGNNYTSSGARLQMWSTSIQLFLQAPLFGHGTGSYHGLAEAAFNDVTMCQIGCFHPHNQFLFFGVDFGLLGLGLFLFFLFRIFQFARKERHAESPLIIAFLSILFVDAMVHGPLWLHMEAYFFFTMTALLMSRASIKKSVMRPDEELGPKHA